MAIKYGVGATFPREDTTYTDPDTGVLVRQLTGSVGNSNHLYFTNNGWYDQGNRLVFCSDRSGKMNLYSIYLPDGTITQLTDLATAQEANHMLEAIVDPIKNRCYFFCDHDLYAIDLLTLRRQVIYQMPAGYEPHIVSCAPGANYIYTSIFKDVRAEITEIPPDSRPFVEKFKKINHSKIVKIRFDGSGYEYIHEDAHWIAHVNVNPKNEEQITFCHEGPWHLVDNRMFGMNTATGQIWKLHPHDQNEVIGHEYWYADGSRLGYHGSIRGTKEKLMGTLGFDGQENATTAFNFNTGHIFSFNDALIVGDGNAPGKYLRLWKKQGDAYAPPRALCGHFSSFKTQNDHAHPRFTDDCRQVLFSSDREGYTNLYLAVVPSFESLPPLAQFSDI